MSFTVSELQSIIKKNSNHIASLEYSRQHFLQSIRSIKKSGYNVPQSFYDEIRYKSKEIASLVKSQLMFKREMKNLLEPTNSTQPQIIISSDSGFSWKIVDSTLNHIEPKKDCEPAMQDTIQNGIGDVNSNEKGSAARYNGGKPDFSLIPLCTMEGEARVWMKGAIKYGPHNWMRGAKWSVPFSSLMRHLSKFQAGEDIDSETGEFHIDHIMCNARMLKLYSMTFKEGDDRPKEWLTQ